MNLPLRFIYNSLNCPCFYHSVNTSLFSVLSFPSTLHGLKCGVTALCQNDEALFLFIRPSATWLRFNYPAAYTSQQLLWPSSRSETVWNYSDASRTLTVDPEQETQPSSSAVPVRPVTGARCGRYGPSAQRACPAKRATPRGTWNASRPTVPRLMCYSRRQVTQMRQPAASERWRNPDGRTSEK